MYDNKQNIAFLFALKPLFVKGRENSSVDFKQAHVTEAVSETPMSYLS